MISKEERFLVWMLARASLLRIIAQARLDLGKKFHANDKQYKVSREYQGRIQRIADYDEQIAVVLEELERLNPKLKSKVIKELMRDITIFRKYLFSDDPHDSGMCKIVTQGYRLKWQNYQGDEAPSPSFFSQSSFLWGLA